LMVMIRCPRRLVWQRADARRQHDDKAHPAVKRHRVGFS
jgi:hypothetical protein